MEKKLPQEKDYCQFREVTIVGYGATGRLYYQYLNSLPLQNLDVIVHKNLPPDNPKSLERLLERQSQLLILATQNPIDNVINKISQLVHDGTTIVLPQNGVDVVGKALTAFDATGKNIHLVRASLMTTVAQDNSGKLAYSKKRKPRIAFAQVTPGNEVIAVEQLFQSAGFDTMVCHDYIAMEWTKLLTNTIGSTAVVTGLSVRDTFKDKELFKKELRGLKDRLMILQAAGIRLADLPGVPIEMFKLIQKVPIEVLLLLTPLRNQFAEYIAKQRNNLPPASQKQLKDGKIPEAIYYHLPFIQLGESVALHSLVDEEIYRIISLNSSSPG